MSNGSRGLKVIGTKTGLGSHIFSMDGLPNDNGIILLIK